MIYLIKFNNLLLLKFIIIKFKIQDRKIDKNYN